MRHSLLFVLLLALILGVRAQNGYWQQRVEYVMNIDFNVDNHQFAGDQSLTYFNNSPDTLYKVFYHLYFNAFQPGSMMDVRSRTIEDPDGRVMDRISKLAPNEIGYHKIDVLTQNGKATSWIIEQTTLEVTLAEPIPPGGQSVFKMKFNSQVPLQIRRSGRDNREGIAYSMSQWFPKLAEYDKDGWHPHPYIGREFYAPWGDYEVNITIDKSFVVAASGIIQNGNEVGEGYEDDGVKPSKIKGKTKTWRFKAENVHDFMWAADPDYVHTKAQVPNGPKLHFFYEEDTIKPYWEQLPELTVKSFQYLSENFGEYPYPVFYVIQGGDGGMEYPMSTLITGHRSLNSLLGVTIHEALHSWYQGVLATNESYYAWMDEGFTSYASGLAYNHVLNTGSEYPQRGNYMGYYALASSGKEEPMTTHADQFETNFAYGRAAYSKGAVTANQLGYIIGDEALKRTMLRYFNEWKFKHPDKQDFLRIAEKESGLVLDWYFDYWVNTTKTIDYAIKNVEGQDAQVSVQLERIGQMPMPIDLVVTKTDGSQVMYYIPLVMMRGEKQKEDLDYLLQSDWPWTHPTYQLTLDIPMEEIAKIQIDPSGRMADLELINNSWSPEGN